MEVERTIEFLLSEQARFWAGLQELRDQQAALQKQQAALQDHQATLQQNQTDLTSVVMRVAEQQLELVHVVRQGYEGTHSAIMALAEAQNHTNGQINTLIEIVDGLIRQRPKQ